ncbi:MAG TPA: CDP-alcohol phosphatidyltransferase family protein [Candidatus Limnocylindria bacterium]|nr:CDP-alcohol phosphatidyltransferase family protein [Candidatus Limnocylindria bacterium]
MQLTLANCLTLLRLCAIPVFLVFLVDGRYRTALAIFVAAGVTDALDGAIARLTHTKTTLGSFLDPAADKLLLLSAFIALGFLAAIPRWLVVIVLSRDTIVVLGYFLLFVMTKRTMEVRPSLVGKLATFFQLTTVSLALLSLVQGRPLWPVMETSSAALAGLMTVGAGVQYVVRGLRWAQGSEDVPA